MKTQLYRSLAILTVVLILLIGMPWLGQAAPPAQGPPPPRPPSEMLIDRLKQETDGAVRISYHPETGKVRFIGVSPDRTIAQPSILGVGASPEEAARGFLATYGVLFGLKDPFSELTVMKEGMLEGDLAFVRFQQTYQGVPIVAGELIVQVNAGRNIVSANGEILPDLDLNINPTITFEMAHQAALEEVGKEYGLSMADLTASKPELWIFNPALLGGPRPRFNTLVWRTEVIPVGQAPIREFVLVDAQRGGVILHFNQIDTARNRQTYTANNGYSLPGTLVCNESNPTCSGGDAHAVAAHRYAGDTYNYYWNTHGRDSIDNAGMTLISTVHYGSDFANAGWTGTQMVYGDAYGFPLADDVVAHELTHGVTQYESNLFYYYQSGAINESLSDVWGEFVDLTNGAGNDSSGVRWLLGEDITGMGAIRSMQNPPAFGAPDRMTSTYYDTGDSDNGGVHTNSGINNKAAYLLTDGGTFNAQTVTGLGITKVVKIYYRAQTSLLTSGSDYADLYDTLYQACLDLVGTSGITTGDCQEVRDATNAVEMNQQPVADYNTEAPICSTGQTPNNLFFDNLESGAGNWAFGALSGTSRWGYDSPYGPFAHSGVHFLYADDYPATISDSYAAMKSSVTLPAGAFLHFAHAYGFEGPRYDGGVLEYSTNGGASWNDAAALFTHNGYDGTVSTSYSNPLGGRSAFLDDSHGYISSRLDLASLAGQSVRFRWRMGLDSSGFDWGWWLDDVRIYTCGGGSPPLAPSNLMATAVSQTQINLSWQDNSSDESDFHIERSPNGSTSWVEIATVGANVTSYSNTGLTCGTPYYYRIRAHRHGDGQYSGYSNVAVATPSCGGGCNDPHEPNNTPGQATPIGYGTTLTDPDICPAGDVDYYRFSGNAGDTIIADIDAQSIGSYLDSYLYLYNTDGSTELTHSDDYDGLDSRIVYVLPANGTYYLMVREYSHPNEGGPDYFYTILLSLVPPPFDVLTNWTSNTPTIDGLISTGEWDDASVYDIANLASLSQSQLGPGAQALPEVPLQNQEQKQMSGVSEVQPLGAAVTLYAMNDGTHLYLAIDNPNDTTIDDYDQMGVYFDDNPLPSDGQWTNVSCGNPDGEGNFWVLTSTVIYREIAAGPTFCTLVAPAPGTSGAVGYNSGHAQAEIAIDLTSSALRAAPGNTINMYLWIFDYNTDTMNGEWPSLADFQNPDTYGDLILAPGLGPGTDIYLPIVIKNQ
jgi:bacillolysin